MFGWINDCTEQLIITKFGIGKWHEIKRLANCQVKDYGFIRHEYYPDSSTVDLVVAASSILGLSTEEVLEAFGQYFHEFTRTAGYENLLNCLGSNLRLWMSNMNSLHDHLQSSLPGGFVAPVFWCEDEEETVVDIGGDCGRNTVDGEAAPQTNAILLHYYSKRGSLLVPLVVGVVKEVARFHFDVEIEMERLGMQGEIVEEKLEEEVDEHGEVVRSNKRKSMKAREFTTWRIRALEEDQQWKLSRDKPPNESTEDDITSPTHAHDLPDDVPTVLNLDIMTPTMTCPFSGVTVPMPTEFLNEDSLRDRNNRTLNEILAKDHQQCPFKPQNNQQPKTQHDQPKEEIEIDDSHQYELPPRPSPVDTSQKILEENSKTPNKYDANPAEDTEEGYQQPQPTTPPALILTSSSSAPSSPQSPLLSKCIDSVTSLLSCPTTTLRKQCNRKKKKDKIRRKSSAKKKIEQRLSFLLEHEAEEEGFETPLLTHDLQQTNTMEITPESSSQTENHSNRNLQDYFSSPIHCHNNDNKHFPSVPMTAAELSANNHSSRTNTTNQFTSVNISSSLHSHVSQKQKHILTLELLHHIFPYHIIVDRSLTILQIGPKLPILLCPDYYVNHDEHDDKHNTCPFRSSSPYTPHNIIGAPIGDVLTITRPVLMGQWDWKVLNKLADQTFFMEPTRPITTTVATGSHHAALKGNHLHHHQRCKNSRGNSSKDVDDDMQQSIHSRMTETTAPVSNSTGAPTNGTTSCNSDSMGSIITRSIKFKANMIQLPSTTLYGAGSPLTACGANFATSGGGGANTNNITPPTTPTTSTHTHHLGQGLVLFVLSPDAKNVSELTDMGLTMSDLPLHSFQRDAVFLGEHIASEVRSAHQLQKLSLKLENEKNLSQSLLYTMLPKNVADELRTGRTVEPAFYENVTLFFSDVVGFTNICSAIEAWDVIDLLNQLYTVMDYLAEKFDLYKVETIGDAYMCCSGMPYPDEYHAEKISNFALAVMECVKHVRSPADGTPISLRIGVHTGQCMGGVVGTLTPHYCLFGDMVNSTARHESTGLAGRIQCSSVLYGRLKHFSPLLKNGRGDQYHWTPRGLVQMKGKGECYTYWLERGSEHNIEASPAAIQRLFHEVGMVLAKKKWKKRQYFRRGSVFSNSGENSVVGSDGMTMFDNSSNGTVSEMEQVDGWDDCDDKFYNKGADWEVEDSQSVDESGTNIEDDGMNITFTTESEEVEDSIMQKRIEDIVMVNSFVPASLLDDDDDDDDEDPTSSDTPMSLTSAAQLVNATTGDGKSNTNRRQNFRSKGFRTMSSSSITEKHTNYSPSQPQEVCNTQSWGDLSWREDLNHEDLASNVRDIMTKILKECILHDLQKQTPQTHMSPPSPGSEGRFLWAATLAKNHITQQNNMDILDSHLYNYIRRISMLYRNECHFHSWYHACHIVLGVNFLISKIQGHDKNGNYNDNKNKEAQEEGGNDDTNDKNSNNSNKSDDHLHDPWLRFVITFAALIHDTKHLGVTNRQLQVEKHMLFQLFGEKGSCQERHSLHLGLSILVEEFPVLYGVIIAGCPMFIRWVSQAVLATDIASRNVQRGCEEKFDRVIEQKNQQRQYQNTSPQQTPKQKTNPKQKQNGMNDDGNKIGKDGLWISTTTANISINKNSNNEEDYLIQHHRNLLTESALEQLLLSADVGHCSQRYETFLKWNRLFFQECLASHLQDRGDDPRIGWFEGQIPFLEKYILPLVTRCETLMPKPCGMKECVERNLRRWKSEGRAWTDRMVDDLMPDENGRVIYWTQNDVG